MTMSSSNPYSAGEQGLGYIYQGRFALLKYMPALERYLLLYPAVNTNGELAMLFRTGASTANALDTVTSDGDLGNYRIRDLFLLPMSVANTSAAVSFFKSSR